MRRIAFRYNLLRGGGFYARLRAMTADPPHVRMQTGSGINMSFRGTFANYAEDVDGKRMDIDWLSDEVQPVMILDGIEYPLGVYIPTTQDLSINGKREYVTIEAYDRCQRVQDTNSGELLYWPRGTLYLDAVEQLLSAAGITTVFKTPNAAAFTEPREDWEAGTPFLDVANDLLSEINYKPLWFDANGNAILEPAAAPEASQIKHVLSDLDSGTLVVPGITRTNDTFSAPNVFVVVCANPDKSANMVASAVNNNPQSPLSVQRRGRQIVSFRRVDNIASREELQAYADRMRNDSLVSGEIITVVTGLLPGWGVGDVVGLHYGELNSICLSRSFDMELKTGGRMTHTMERVLYNIE